MNDLEDRVAQLERTVIRMAGVIEDQQREIERLKFEVNAGVRQSDLVLVEQQIRAARRSLRLRCA